jgi:NAD(P)-dependent dehydrogenase (short-subunit alcohol dehydrogenase family)
VLVSKNEQPATMTADRALGLFDLTGEVAIVTGGNGGIGLGLARGLAQAGAAVVIAGRDEANNVKAVTKLRDAGARAIDVVADVTGEESCRALVSHRRRGVRAARHSRQRRRDRHRQTIAGLYARRMEYRARHQSFERLSCARGLAILRCCAWAAGRLSTSAQ